MGSIENLLHDEIDALEKMEQSIDDIVERESLVLNDQLVGFVPDLDPLRVIEILEEFGASAIATVESDRTYYDAGIEAAARREALLDADDSE